jgi:hypothetical protein
MSASSASPQVRRTAAAAPSRSATAQPAVRQPASSGIVFADADDGDEIKINLGDIPRMKETLDIEGFKPTLLSRLFDLVAPLR